MMIDALIIFSREGFEAFLIVAIILTYLRKSGREGMVPAVYWGVGVSVLLSAGVGYGLSNIGMEPLWEGILALIAAATVISLVVHMWRTAPRLKSRMETHLNGAVDSRTRTSGFIGVFLFTVFMIAREGVESVLMLSQVRDQGYITGILLGLGIAGVFSWAWGHFGHRVNIRRFFQITGVYLIMFGILLLLTAVHEFSEAHVLPGSEWLHEATEPYSPVGRYGKWFSVVMLGVCILWYAISFLIDRFRHGPSVTAPTTPQ